MLMMMLMLVNTISASATCIIMLAHITSVFSSFPQRKIKRFFLQLGCKLNILSESARHFQLTHFADIANFRNFVEIIQAA